MKAIRVHQFGGPEVLKIDEIPVPQPAPKQVLVRVQAVGVNPVETYIRSGAYAALPPLPFTPGMDAAGTIEAAGSDVKNVRVGDRVFTSRTLTGAYAEFALCEATEVHSLPERVSFAQGAALNIPYATAYRGLIQRAKAQRGEIILVHGATGGVGTAAVQFARAAGMTVFGTAGSAPGEQHVLAQGAHRVFNHRAPDYLQQISAATEGRGVHVILEMLANVNLGHDLTLLAKHGRVIVIGSRGKVEINPRDAMARDADIRGVMLGNAEPDERAAIYAAIVAGLRDGTLNPVVGRELPLAEAASAHEAIMQPGALGKIVLVP